jgi:bifunctional non-homologous end joining protein LigD
MKSPGIDQIASGFCPPGKSRRPHVKLHFMVHAHRPRMDHFDLRLERDGVLKCWVVPKGPPREPGEKRLAIEVVDHPLAWASFEGAIPSGHGAETVRIWDRGTYVLHGWARDRIVFDLHGSILEGRYGLIRYPRNGNTHWLLLKYDERHLES